MSTTPVISSRRKAAAPSFQIGRDGLQKVLVNLKMVHRYPGTLRILKTTWKDKNIINLSSRVSTQNPCLGQSYKKLATATDPMKYNGYV